MWLEGRLSQESGLLRGSREGLDTHRAREDAWPSDSPLENPPPRPPVTQSFLCTHSLRSWESCWEVWPMGNRAVFWVAERAPVSTDRCPGTLWNCCDL